MRQGEESALNEEDTALAALAAENYSQAVENSLEVAHKQQTDITVGSHVRQAFQQVGHVVHRSAASSGKHCVSVLRQRLHFTGRQALLTALRHHCGLLCQAGVSAVPYSGAKASVESSLVVAHKQGCHVTVGSHGGQAIQQSNPVWGRSLQSMLPIVLTTA